MTYPASSYPEGVDLTIIAGNQLHQVINGEANEVVSTTSGDIPSVRKALADSMMFKVPVDWVQGEVTTDPLETRLYNGQPYWAPEATLANPITLGISPVATTDWLLAPQGYRNDYNLGKYQAGILISDSQEYVVYNGKSYFATNPPYTTTATTPDADGNLFVGEYLNQSTNLSASPVTATGSTTPRTLGDRFADVANATDYGVVNDFYVDGIDKNTNPTDNTQSFIKMIDDGVLNIPKGDFLVSQSLVIDLRDIHVFHIEQGASIHCYEDITVLDFSGISSNYNFNGLKVVFHGENLTSPLIDIHGTDYGTGLTPTTVDGVKNSFARVSFENIYAVNLNGIVSGGGGLTPDRGAAFRITTTNDGSGELAKDTMCWCDYTVNATGFYDAVQFGALGGGGEGNFISTCTVNLTSWWCVNALVDITEQGTTANIGNMYFNMFIQPQGDFEKAVKVVNGVGGLERYHFFNITLWDAHVIGFTTGIVDARFGNTYSFPMETPQYPSQLYMNYLEPVYWPVTPIDNVRITKPTKRIVTDPNSVSYTYFRDCDSTMTALEMCSQIKSNYENYQITDCILFEGDAWNKPQVGVDNVFMPFFNDMAVTIEPGNTPFNCCLTIKGNWQLDTYYMNGKLDNIRVVYKSARVASGGRYAHIIWEWQNDGSDDGVLYSWIEEFKYGTTNELNGLKNPVKGLTSFNTTTENLQVFRNPYWVVCATV